MSRPRAVLLDALGTLVALEPPAGPLRAALRDRLDVEVDAATAERAIAAEIAYYRAHHLEGRDPASLEDLRRRCATVLRAALGPAAATLPVDGVKAALLEALRFSPYPDASRALPRLAAAGARLVVVSNWDCGLPAVLEGAGLREYLVGVVTSAEAGSAKPDSAVFEYALAMAQTGPDRAIHVGDSAAEDVEGARAAGVEPVMISRGGETPEIRVRTIRSLDELTLPAA